ncbi:MAG: acyl-CoA thioesterase II [Alphaproteobacteria bacterium]|nr:acyl-CoA thioesterase II [Alphaproteobacteria bacterium]MCB9797433.1 acyl-CoA thioesterase II [Alphaproteobacteria bacterium]
MRDVLRELLDLLRLEKIEENLFRGPSQNLGWGVVFGGQVLGQALSAAEQTVPEDRPVHSLHAYFLLPGDVRAPIVYEVDRIRDGGTFTTRRVKAIQHGRAIFNLAASFQEIEPGLEHQDAAPVVPDVEVLPTQQELVRRIAHKLPAGMRRRNETEQPIEIRPIDPEDPTAPEPRPPRRQVWMRVPDTLPDDPRVHRHLLAYASDFQLLTTAMLPHGVSWMSPGYQVASLDHAMYLHHPVRFDDWLLYDIESPIASGGRGLTRGRFFDRSGKLVATTVQEGLMRKRPAKS